jgi:S-adenosylmethionine:tRNA ribosyltransferase-isomerase
MTIFFDYDLPTNLIAQEPCAERDQSRLLVVRRTTGAIEHRSFADLPRLLSAGDLLVLNDTRVVPARLLGRRARTGGKWEGLFLRVDTDGLWEMLSQTRGRLLTGESIEIEPGPLRLELVRKTSERHWLARPSDAANWREVLARHGQVPLPPYIRKGRAAQGDTERYQTVYARQPGAVAAPTAGLHFTPVLFERLAERGVGVTHVTLHVGAGTFQPIQVEDFRQHRMHREWGDMTAETCRSIAECQRNGGRVVAVGTTTVRVLETVAAMGPLQPWCGETELFIYPPYEFKIVDTLITNFHLPRSTLLLLVGAFAGNELLRRAYNIAVEQRYRFYSYGDAMLVI